MKTINSKAKKKYWRFKAIELAHYTHTYTARSVKTQLAKRRAYFEERKREKERECCKADSTHRPILRYFAIVATLWLLLFLLLISVSPVWNCVAISLFCVKFNELSSDLKEREYKQKNTRKLFPPTNTHKCEMPLAIYIRRIILFRSCTSCKMQFEYEKCAFVWKCMTLSGVWFGGAHLAHAHTHTHKSHLFCLLLRHVRTLDWRVRLVFDVMTVSICCCFSSSSCASSPYEILLVSLRVSSVWTYRIQPIKWGYCTINSCSIHIWILLLLLLPLLLPTSLCCFTSAVQLHTMWPYFSFRTLFELMAHAIFKRIAEIDGCVHPSTGHF